MSPHYHFCHPSCLSCIQRLPFLTTRHPALTSLNLRLNRLEDSGAKALFEGLHGNDSLTALNVARYPLLSTLECDISPSTPRPLYARFLAIAWAARPFPPFATSYRSTRNCGILKLLAMSLGRRPAKYVLHPVCIHALLCNCTYSHKHSPIILHDKNK